MTRDELAAETLAYAARTSLSQAAKRFGVDYNTVRQWAYAARQREAANMPPPADQPLDVPPDPPADVIETEGAPEPTWVPLEQKLAQRALKAEIVAHTPDTAAVDALVACFVRIKKTADTAPLKEVIRATQVLGELILAANVTNQPLARRLAQVSGVADRMDPKG